MKKDRLLAFTDGVMAIIITIMVLELDIPKEITQSEIISFISNILIYLLSFIYVGLYWGNHHHLFYGVKKINGKIIILNLMLLFTLSLMPLSTRWISFSFTTVPLLFYGLCLISSALVYLKLIKSLLKIENSHVEAIFIKAGFKKEFISILCYTLGIIFAFINTYISILFYAIVALIWIIPDKKIEDYFSNLDNK